MLRKVLQYCKKENLIENGDYVLAGVSGGADSVCLLKMLVKLQQEIRFSLGVVHVEHGIRGEESKTDAIFVEQLCEQLQVPVFIYDVEAVKYAKEHHLGIEEAARILRYDCYKKAAEQLSKTKVKIALAHHADDNAETVLFQMVRGSGIDGMSGIRQKRELQPGTEVIRPLLLVTRSQIETYLEKEGQAYRIDSTNADMSYSRNKIRGQVLPMLVEINQQAVSHINQTAMLLRELGDYLNIQVEAAAEEVLQEQKNGILVRKEQWVEFPQIIRKEVLHLALERMAGSAKDIGMEHVEALMELFELQVGKSRTLPYNISAKRVYEGVRLERMKAQDEAIAVESFCLEFDKQELEKQFLQGAVTVEIPDGEIQFSLLHTDEENAEISKNTYTKCFDYDKIKDSFQIRTRKSGDYLIVDENGHKKKLKEYFINEKVPSDLRDTILLLTQDKKVLWVMGGRISADIKVNHNTRRILKVQISGGNYYED